MLIKEELPFYLVLSKQIYFIFYRRYLLCSICPACYNETTNLWYVYLRYYYIKLDTTVNHVFPIEILDKAKNAPQ